MRHVKTITRQISVAERRGPKTSGFYEAFLLGDTAFIYSLQGRGGFLKTFDLESLKGSLGEYDVARIVFLMEPKTFNLLKHVANFNVVRKTVRYDIVLLWVELEL